MIDLMFSVVDLEQAVARLAADISDQEVYDEQRRQKNDTASSIFLNFTG
jgi:hypothetical protein